MKRAIIFIICIFLAAGCNKKSKEVIQAPQNPCMSAPRACWGERNQNPETIDSCNQLISCSDWEMWSRGVR